MEFPTEALTSLYGKHKFLLKCRSLDQDYQFDASSPFTAQDNIVYLQLLQVVSTSSETLTCDSISPNIINRHDKSQGIAPLHYACINGNLPMVTYLLENGAEADIWDVKKNVTPLICAAAQGHVEVLKVLLSNASVNVNSVNADGRTPLHFSAMSKNVEIVKLLLDNEANADAEDSLGRTPLYAYTIIDEKIGLDCMKALIQKGKCEINHQDNYGVSPLHLAGNYGAAGAAEFLLLNGSDFSIRARGGISALSALRKNIPTTGALLRNTFNQAVKLSYGPRGGSQTGHEQNCEVEVDFKYVIPSIPSKNGQLDSNSIPEITIQSNLKMLDEKRQSSLRKETSKLKCLMEEEYSDILVHPVIHSFLDLKWKKVRFLFLITMLFKMIFILLFSFFMIFPYIVEEGDEKGKNETSVPFILNTSNLNGTIDKENVGKPHLPILQGMFWIIVFMATVNAQFELLEIFRAPKQQLGTLHPWLSFTLWLTILLNKPTTWEAARDPDKSSLVAVTILLGWVDVYADLARFPVVGHSIRVFLRVLKNFIVFILPHFCLLLGFTLSFSLVFHEHKEYSSPLLTITKLIRVMGGDISIASVGLANKTIEYNTNDGEFFNQQLLYYLYTTYVLIIAVVLMNLLVALAVFDLQKIFEGAAVDKVVKQTILLNTLENSFSGHWTKRCLPRGIFSNYINLFPPQGSFVKTKTFNPHDSRDPTFSSELKIQLFSIGTANRESYLKRKQLENQLHSIDGQDDEQQTMKDFYEKLKPIILYFESRIPRQ